MVLANFWSRVNETTSEVFQKQIIWELVTKSIKHEKCDGLSPAVSFLKCVSRLCGRSVRQNKNHKM